MTRRNETDEPRSLKPRRPTTAKGVLITGLVAGAFLGAMVTLRPALAVGATLLSAVALGALWAPRAIALGLAPILIVLHFVPVGPVPVPLLVVLLPAMVLVLVSRRKMASRSNLLLGALSALLVLSYTVTGRESAAANVVCPAFACPDGPPSRLAHLLFLLGGLLLCGVIAAARPPASWVVGVIGVITAGASIAVFTGGMHYGRVNALGLNANYLAAAISVGLVVAVVQAVSTKRLWWTGLAILATLAVMVTSSRAGYVAIFAGLFAAFLIGRRRVAQVAMVSVATVVIVVLPGAIGVFTGSALAHRAERELAVSDQLRRDVLLLSVREAAEHPLLGVGYGLFPATALLDGEMSLYVSTHNEYARLAAEAGAPSLILFGVIVVRMLRGTEFLTHGASVRGGLAAFLVSLLFGNYLPNLLVSIPFLLLGGVALGALRVPKASRGREAAKLSRAPGGMTAQHWSPGPE